MREAGDETCTGDKRDAHRILVGKLKERSRLEYLELYGMMSLKWIFKKLK
jgi:hypothetical protein